VRGIWIVVRLAVRGIAHTPDGGKGQAKCNQRRLDIVGTAAHALALSRVLGDPFGRKPVMVSLLGIPLSTARAHRAYTLGLSTRIWHH
jgi:hypothetical protein